MVARRWCVDWPVGCRRGAPHCGGLERGGVGIPMRHGTGAAIGCTANASGGRCLQRGTADIPMRHCTGAAKGCTAGTPVRGAAGAAAGRKVSVGGCHCMPAWSHAWCPAQLLDWCAKHTPLLGLGRGVHVTQMLALGRNLEAGIKMGSECRHGRINRLGI